MGKFFFDFRERGGQHSDLIGSELADIEAARLVATAALMQFAQDRFASDKPDQTVEISIREDGGPPLMIVKIALTTEPI